MIPEPSWAELERSANTTPKRIMLALQMIPFAGCTYAKFVSLVEDALTFSMSNMVSLKNLLNDGLCEDQLTAFLSAPLLGMSFDISHDTNQAGHCDVFIRGPHDMLWLGEAKIFTDYTKLMKGFQQISDRYAPGLGEQTSGGLIIYMFGEKILDTMANWKAYLLESRVGLYIEEAANTPLQFLSIEPHRATQQALTIRHMPVPLFHRPTDVAPPPRRTRRAIKKL